MRAKLKYYDQNQIVLLMLLSGATGETISLLDVTFGHNFWISCLVNT